jgi:hypothetical protein
MNKLAKKLQSREVEIGVLVNMLNQRKNRAIAWTQTSTATGSESQRIEVPKLDKKQAFQEFVKNHRKFGVVEANNATMREKIQQAKALGDEAQALKMKISEAKQQLQERADEGADEEELGQMGGMIGRETDRYLKMCADMRALKKEVETITAMTAQVTKQVKKDFTNFWMSQQPQEVERPSSSRSIGRNRTEEHIESPRTSEGRTSGRRSRNEGARLRLGGSGDFSESLTERPEPRLTGDPRADETIRKFAESRAMFLRKAEEARRSQTNT